MLHVAYMRGFGEIVGMIGILQLDKSGFFYEICGDLMEIVLFTGEKPVFSGDWHEICIWLI